MSFIIKCFIHTINDYSCFIVLRTRCKAQACTSTPTRCPPENGRAAVVKCSIKLFQSLLSYTGFNVKELFFLLSPPSLRWLQVSWNKALRVFTCLSQSCSYTEHSHPSPLSHAVDVSTHLYFLSYKILCFPAVTWNQQLIKMKRQFGFSASVIALQELLYCRTQKKTYLLCDAHSEFQALVTYIGFKPIVYR